jgi:hypothetical protein
LGLAPHCVNSCGLPLQPLSPLQTHHAIKVFINSDTLLVILEIQKVTFIKFPKLTI